MIKAFPKILSIGAYPIEKIFDDEVEITEKIDGCVTYESPLILSNGSKIQIGKVVNNKLPLEVLTYNLEKNVLEAHKITNWFKKETTDDWLKIKIRGDNGQYLSLKCTPNHNILLFDKGWTEARNIKPGDFVCKRELLPHPIIPDIIYGILLGDGYLSATVTRLDYSHSYKQIELLDIIQKVFNGFSIYKYDYTSGYGSKCCRLSIGSHPLLKEISQIINTKGRKKITKKWLKNISPISLAWWYMDDGSWNHSEKQQGYARFATNSFTHSELDLLISMLKTKFNLKGKTFNDTGRGEYIALDTKSSERLFALINPYIPKSLQYKLPIKFHVPYCYWDMWNQKNTEQLTPKEVISVQPYSPNNKMRYDIEVGSAHNYFISDILIHNSQFVFGKIEGQLYIRSKGVEIIEDAPQQMFFQAVNYIRLIRHEIPDNRIFYCEYLLKPKHNILQYARIPKNNLILFGVSTPANIFFSEYEHYATKLNLEVVPVLFKGKINGAVDLLKFLDITSILGGTKIEGIVIKNYIKGGMIGGSYNSILVGKYVSEAFKEKHKTDWKREYTSKGRWAVFKEQFCTPARWEKAVQHLNEKNELEHAPKDIGKLIHELKNDITEEEQEIVKQMLWNEMKEDLFRRIIKGFPEWYKEKLLKETTNV